jgi:DNA-binding NarL/FixJ family response regulator
VGETWTGVAITFTMALQAFNIVYSESARGGAVPIEHSLTSRQWDVLELIAQGYHNHEIAALLMVSESTVHSHVAALLRLLKVHDRHESGRMFRDGRLKRPA